MSEKLWFTSYHQWAEDIAPQLHVALSGNREVLPQDPFNEAWMAYALFRTDSPLPVLLMEVIAIADGINHSIPNPDEIAWAFLRLKERGWLAVEGDSYGLTAEGRNSIKSIVGGGGYVNEEMDLLKDWISIHAPSGDR
jgi:hypothetical protein